MKTYLTKIKTTNFKGLGDFEYIPKSKGVNVIYGENGSGKTSFVNIFYFLTLINDSLKIKNQYTGNHQPSQNLGKQPANGALEIYNDLYGSFVTSGSDGEPISIEIEFSIDSALYSYKVSLDFTSSIIYENLRTIRKTDKETKKNIIIKDQLKNEFFVDENLLLSCNTMKNELYSEVPSSFLSILAFNESLKTDYYSHKKSYKNDVEKSIVAEISTLITIMSITTNEGFKKPQFRRTISLLPSWTMNVNGDIEYIERFEKEVEKFEEFVTNIDDKIIAINMEKTPNIHIPNLMTLEMSFDMRISGKIRRLKYDDMSAGTRDYLKYFYVYLLITLHDGAYLKGSIPIFDEFGIHLHPTLASNMMNYINKLSIENDAQFFTTTHNTIFLNKKYSTLNNKQKQILYRDIKGNCHIKTLENTGNRENHETKYLRGDYGGNQFKKIDF